jgi:molecular chaperone HtpG
MEDITEPGKFYTLEEYKEATTALQTNKDGKLVVLYATNAVQQDSYIQAAKNKGYKIVKLDTIVDAAFINNMEPRWDTMQFTRVDADIADNLVDVDEKSESVLSSDQETKLKELFGHIPQQHVKVELKGLSADAQPVIVTRPEFMRRMKDMAAVGGSGMSWYANMPDEINMTINANHPIYLQILDENDNEKQQKQVRNLADLALLSQNLLTGADLTAFVNRSVELMSAEKKN